MPALAIQQVEPKKLSKPQPICLCCGGPRSAFSAGHCKTCYSKKTRPANFDTAAPLAAALVRRNEWMTYYLERNAEIERGWERKAARLIQKAEASERKARLAAVRAEFLAEIKRANDEWRAGKLQEIAAKKALERKEKLRQRAPSPGTLSYPYVSAVRATDADLLLVNSLVPRFMEGREDVCQEIMIAIWEKRLTIEDIKCNRADLKKFIGAFRRDNFESGGYAISLDEPMRDGRSWHDVLVDPATV